MPKVREDCSKNMQFFPEEGKVNVLASSEEEQEQYITQFQNTYQDIIKNHQLKYGSLEIPPSFQMENMFDLLEEFDGRYSQCHFSCDEKAQVVKIISMSSRQFDQARKLLGDRLAGEKWEKSWKKKEEKGGGGGGGGKPGKGATGIKISTKTGSSEVLSINKDRKLTVKRGNLVEEDVEIIVNAANSQLKHTGGVALALNKASHGELQKLSNNYTRSYGDVPVGGTALTRSGGGKLKCKWVIHAVGPIAHEVKSEVTCSELIFKAITNSLIEAQKKNAKSISFPALSTRIYAVNKSLAADAIFQAILKFHYTSSKILKDIRIIILDEDTYSVFAQHLLAVKAAGTEALNGKEEETSFQTAADHVVSTTTHQGYDSPTYQGYGQPTPTSYSSAVGGGYSSAVGRGYSSSASGGYHSSYSSTVGGGSPVLGTEGHPPSAGRGISSTGTPPGFHHSPITTQPTGQPVIPPHTSVVTSSSFLTTTTATGRGDVVLKPPLFNYEGRGGGSIGAGGVIGRGTLTTGGIGTGGDGAGGIGTEALFNFEGLGGGRGGGSIGAGGVIGRGTLTTGGIGTGGIGTEALFNFEGLGEGRGGGSIGAGGVIGRGTLTTGGIGTGGIGTEALFNFEGLGGGRGGGSIGAGGVIGRGTLTTGGIGTGGDGAGGIGTGGIGTEALFNFEGLGEGRGGGSIGAGGVIGRGTLTTGGIGTGGDGVGGIGTGGIGTEALFNFGGLGGGRGGGSIGAGGVIGRGTLTTGGIGTGGNGTGGIGTEALFNFEGLGRGRGGGSIGAGGVIGRGTLTTGGIGTGADGNGGGIGSFGAETGGIQGGGFGRGGEGVGGGQEGWQQQQQVPGGAVTNKLLTPADLAPVPPAGITRSSSHDDQYSTLPDSLTHSHNKGEGATPSGNKTDDDKGIMTV